MLPALTFVFPIGWPDNKHYRSVVKHVAAGKSHLLSKPSTKNMWSDVSSIGKAICYSLSDLITTLRNERMNSLNQSNRVSGGKVILGTGIFLNKHWLPEQTFYWLVSCQHTGIPSNNELKFIYMYCPKANGLFFLCICLTSIFVLFTFNRNTSFTRKPVSLQTALCSVSILVSM